MAKRILKYQLEEKQILMPKGAIILTVQIQYEVPVIWAMCDDTAENEVREFIIQTTGSAIYTAHPLGYISTFQYNGFVGHVFEIIKP